MGETVGEMKGRLVGVDDTGDGVGGCVAGSFEGLWVGSLR